MLGWMILFAIGALSTFAGTPASTSAHMAGSVFALLFVLGLLTRLARGPAW
jgi:hypothetical protein